MCVCVLTWLEFTCVFVGNTDHSTRPLFMCVPFPTQESQEKPVAPPPVNGRKGKCVCERVNLSVMFYCVCLCWIDLV